MQIVPLSIAHLVSQEMSALFAVTHEYLAPDDERLIDIDRDLEKLASKRADQSSVLRVRYGVLMGDRDMAEYWLRNAERLRAERGEIELARLVMCVNLGYYSEAMAPLAYVIDPANGFASGILAKPPGTGALRMHSAMFDKAEKMNILDFPQRPSFLPDAIQAMDYWGETDEDYSAALDVAGEVLRSHKMLMMEHGFSVSVDQPRDGSPGLVKLALRVVSDFDKCLDMTSEYTDKLAKSRIKIPQSMIFEFVPDGE